MKNSCIFCAIVAGEMDSYPLYEDDLFYVMLDRFPKCMGHTLILPKRHAATLFDLSETEAAQLLPLAKRVAAALHKVYDFDGLNLLQNNGAAAGQEVEHFHLHLIPRFDRDSFHMQYTRQDPSAEEFAEAVARIKAAI